MDVIDAHTKFVMAMHDGLAGGEKFQQMQRALSDLQAAVARLDFETHGRK